MIEVVRVYDVVRGGVAPSSGRPAFLVERLWPRGVRRDALAIDGWLKDVAPSTQLRQWYGHDPARWLEFRSRYFEELDAEPNAWQPLAAAAASGGVVLVYSARDEEHNSAVALRDYLRDHALDHV